MNAAARSFAIQGPVQSREVQPATARMRLHVASQIINLDSSSGRFQVCIKLRWNRNRVFGLVGVVTEPIVLALAVRANRHRVAVLRKIDRIILQKLFLSRFAAPPDFTPNIYDNFARGIGSDYDSPEVNIHDDRAAGFNVEFLVNLFLRRPPRCERCQWQKN
jgi:hypothetical protein